jgi:DNA-directed RNA polymerase sigma subunit (sigma70/sigma32)
MFEPAPDEVQTVIIGIARRQARAGRPDSLEEIRTVSKAEEYTIKAISALDEDDCKLIDGRYGLSGELPRTTPELAADLGMTTDEVRLRSDLLLSKLAVQIESRHQDELHY